MNTGKSRSLPGSVDRISDLPDPVLAHILSFLPTKDAVATHILSPRWISVWTITSNLGFHSAYIDSIRFYSFKGEREKFQGQVVKFIDFVNHVLLLHKPKFLNRLSLALECEHVKVDAWISAWISLAVAKDVQELDLKIFMLPIQAQRSIFSCDALKSLELDCSICISSEIAVSLPRLERLKLISVYFRSDEAFNKLLGYRYTAFEGTFVCVQLDTPLIEYIKLEGHIYNIFIQQSLPSLVEVNVQLATSVSEDELQKSFNSVVEAFHAFDCAKTLSVSAQVVRVLSCATIKMRTKFKRLTRLEMKIDRNHWSSLQDFISLSDCLEVLTIKMNYRATEDNGNNSNWKQPYLVPRCLSNSLNTVSITAYCGHHDELAMVAYILKHGSVLQLMQIRFDVSISDFKMKFELVQKISKFLRKSSVCEVDFC